METLFTYPREAGIYKLTCVHNGKIYIGKAINIRKRLSHHKRSPNYSECKTYLKNAILKYGWESFNIEILEIYPNFDKLVNNSQLLKKESEYIKLFESNNPNIGYNICTYSSDCTGLKLRPRGPRSEETKEKLRQANLGKSPSKETREKLSKAGKGRILSAEHKEKLRISAIKRGISKETREKMRATNTGKPLSEEHKAALSKARMGRIFSEETKEKIRQSNLGQIRSEEARENIRLGKIKSNALKKLKQDA